MDAIVAIDGGTDSLMRGDEEGLGDPIEDATTVAAIAAICDPLLTSLSLDIKSVESESCLTSSKYNCESNEGIASRRRPIGILCAVGFGCDRFNGVTDADSFRAIADLTKMGGFLGALAVEVGD